MTDETVHLIPARPDVTVRDPITREPLPAAGELKPLNTYWSRRLVDQDVMVAPGLPASAGTADD
ncbi:DUF2635 domain-containing protein [Roseateles sp. DXS20W]|uniref:DUF2635 domain-containing protein n=1 Tax=Pelomonas lactea TaxID=3299030 RepID=A0ABW7GK05_9BURK